MKKLEILKIVLFNANVSFAGLKDSFNFEKHWLKKKEGFILELCFLAFFQFSLFFFPDGAGGNSLSFSAISLSCLFTL